MVKAVGKEEKQANTSVVFEMTVKLKEFWFLSRHKNLRIAAICKDFLTMKKIKRTKLGPLEQARHDTGAYEIKRLNA
ncbi:MAG: hypothetical protein MI975_15180 [Cytophagales bacterium]|nr:hypothetical protein [Cytophagales bacterium]